MDGLTAELGVEESEKSLALLLEIMRKVAIILISHIHDHILRVSDRSIVLRSSMVAGIFNITDSNKNGIIILVMGAK